MDRLDGDLSLGGWQLKLGFAGGAPGSRNFYAVYPGESFGRPERGILAVMARAHEDAGWRAAQLVVHEFAEGYFGMRPTLGPARAARAALSGVNDWLYAHARRGAADLASVSLVALLFHQRRLGILQIGDCDLLRLRAGAATPLAAASPALGRAIGQDAEVVADFMSDEPAVGDRYILLPKPFATSPPAVLTNESPQDAAARLRDLPGTGAALVVDIVAAPLPAGGADEALAALPLRPAPREGDVWDGFVIGKTLYHGRYTILKAAHDSVENRDVALKIPLPSMLQDEVFAAGFLREAWIGASVRAGNVARYIELPPERRSSLYMAMPLYRGETLEARLHRAPPMSLPDGIGIALKLCEAVRDLATIQIIHRDIKPDNIMLLARSEVRLLDLGLAYLPGIDVQDAVKPGGTLRYMAPELMNGVPANARSEVFALGVTIYRMFAGGAFPFGQGEAVPLRRKRPDLPGWLGEILQTALAADPAARFADAGALGAALQAALISSPDAEPRSRRRIAPLRLWQAATAVFAVGFLALLIRALR